MKIKLDARYEKSRKVAMCFVGSVAKTIDGSPVITVGTHNDFFAVVRCGWAHFTPRIIIDLETAKFDPFAAMRRCHSCAILTDHGI